MFLACSMLDACFGLAFALFSRAFFGVWLSI